MHRRAAVALAVAVAALSGCGRAPAPAAPPPPPPTWSLVLESALLADPGVGVAPSVFVVATVDNNTISSPSVAATPDAAGGFDAVWDTPLLSGEAAVLDTGIDLQVFADYGNGPDVVGEAFYQPAHADYGNGLVDVGAFASVADLTVELTPN